MPELFNSANEFLGNAYALLFPIEWPEPFGLVMIEAMACGTPVIAYKSGSVPEVMEDVSNRFRRERTGRRCGSSSPGSQSQSRVLPRGF
jgi:glycosyltransferase involved in cell wall biosynthesis